MLPLSGKRIVVTRAVNQAEELAEPLRSLGAEVILLPVIGIAPPIDPEPLRQAAHSAHEYDWIIFTSTNAVSAFASERPDLNVPVATIGAATRQAAEKLGWNVTVTPKEYVAEALVEALAAQQLAGKRILIPSAAVTRDVVPPALRELGALVDVVEAYRNIVPAETAERAPQVFQPPYPDWITFASSSAVDNLLSLVGREIVSTTKIATIGPITSATVEKYGLPVAAEAQPHSIAGLITALTAQIH
jgi:uroporphyrinogen-III synthase